MTQTPIEKAIRLHQAGKTDKARSIYQRLLKKNPRNVDALHFYGVLNFQQGKAEKAIELIKRAIENKPDYPDAYNNLGNIYLELEQLDEARRCFEKTIELAPGRIEAHNNLGILLKHLEDYPASERHLLKAIELKPDWADAHYNLANTYALSGYNAQAISHYRAAIDLDPKFSLALKHLGAILYSVGNIDEAVKLYRDWLELDPDNPVVKHLLAACSGENTPERASSEYLEKTFDDFANSFDRKLEILGYRAPQLVSDAAKSQFESDEGTLNILDAGCGTGLCGPLLRPLAQKLTGVDLSQNMLNLANDRKCYDDLAHDDLVTYIDQFNSEYDVIVSADTLVYFGDLSGVFETSARALKPGGLFALSVEKMAEDDSKQGYSLQTHGRYTHDRAYIEKTAKAAGLEVVSIHEGVLRTELKKPVDGLIVTLKKLA